MAQQSSETGDEEPWDLADEDGNDGGTSFLDLHREWSSRQSHFHTLGYRDGIEEGKKSSAQEGFEAGYTQGVKAGLNCGLARGWAGVFTALPHSIQSLLLDDDMLRKQVEESQAALASISSEKATHHFYHNINQMDDWKDKADTNANDTAVDDFVGREDTTSNSRLDSSVNIEKLHLKVQSIVKSNGIIQ